jgi:hypothetical protein
MVRNRIPTVQPVTRRFIELFRLLIQYMHEVEIVGMFVCTYVCSLTAREGMNRFASNLACLFPDVRPERKHKKVKTPEKCPKFDSR